MVPGSEAKGLVAPMSFRPARKSHANDHDASSFLIVTEAWDSWVGLHHECIHAQARVHM